MNFDTKRGFVLLDVILGLALFAAVALLCGYSRQFVQSFVLTSTRVRQAIVAHYNLRGHAEQTCMPVIFEFFQNGECVARYEDVMSKAAFLQGE